MRHSFIYLLLIQLLYFSSCTTEWDWTERDDRSFEEIDLFKISYYNQGYLHECRSHGKWLAYITSLGDSKKLNIVDLEDPTKNVRNVSFNGYYNLVLRSNYVILYNSKGYRVYDNVSLTLLKEESFDSLLRSFEVTEDAIFYIYKNLIIRKTLDSGFGEVYLHPHDIKSVGNVEFKNIKLARNDINDFYVTYSDDLDTYILKLNSSKELVWKTNKGTSNSKMLNGDIYYYNVKDVYKIDKETGNVELFDETNYWVTDISSSSDYLLVSCGDNTIRVYYDGTYMFSFTPLSGNVPALTFRTVIHEIYQSAYLFSTSNRFLRNGSEINLNLYDLVGYTHYLDAYIINEREEESTLTLKQIK